jgi:hypothetical protein
MEHLPPSGWGDVARKSDISYLDERIRGIQHGLWALASLTAACHIATFTILATRL